MAVAAAHDGIHQVVAALNRAGSKCTGRAKSHAGGSQHSKQYEFHETASADCTPTANYAAARNPTICLFESGFHLPILTANGWTA
jgi:hypothetical protein